MSPSSAWFVAFVAVATIHSHIESDCAQYLAYSQKHARAVMVQKSPQNLIGTAYLLYVKGIWSLVFWHVMKI